MKIWSQILDSNTNENTKYKNIWHSKWQGDAVRSLIASRLIIVMNATLHCSPELPSQKMIKLIIALFWKREIDGEKSCLSQWPLIAPSFIVNDCVPMHRLQLQLQLQ